MLKFGYSYEYPRVHSKLSRSDHAKYPWTFMPSILIAWKNIKIWKHWKKNLFSFDSFKFYLSTIDWCNVCNSKSFACHPDYLRNLRIHFQWQLLVCHIETTNSNSFWNQMGWLLTNHLLLHTMLDLGMLIHLNLYPSLF